MCVLGVCEYAVAFTRAHDALGRGNMEKYGILSYRYVGECGRSDENVASYQHGGRAVGSGIAVEIKKKIRDRRIVCRCSSWGQWNLLKIVPHEVVEYRWN